MLALVTGGGGFLGSAIVRELRARGDRVRVFARGEHPAVLALGAELFRGDVRDAAALAAAARDCDAVFHTAAKPPPWGPRADYEAVNVGGTRNVVAACRAASVPVLVHTSTPSVVAVDRDIEGGDESLPLATRFLAEYPRTKALAERLVLEGSRDAAGPRAVALRPHLVWGPGDPHFLPRFVARARSGRLRRIGDGDPLVDTVYVDDAAHAHVLAADRLLAGAPISGRAYFVTAGAPVGAWTMVDRMLAAAGIPPVARRVPAGVARAAALVAEALWRWLPLPGEPPLTRFLVQQLTHAHWFDISAARRDLGYEPRVSLDDGLVRLASWWRAEHGALR
jgi:nucleoside-diphosphate-sugar epimerase